ncbi:Gfo/Idh/MocA family oxidoreductase [soil metagenome]
MRGITRRRFNKVAATTLAAPMFVQAKNRVDKLRIAMIACGGRGGHNMNSVGTEEIVALCDVNADAVEAAAKKHPEAKKYSDFRKVFDKPNDFDAVMVSTCEHTHYHATMLALKNKKHVYCEKPLSHNVWEARELRLAAAKAGVVTQMGIQNHANPNYRRVVELIQGGVIGNVSEVHVWVSRAWGLQSEAAAKRNKDIEYITERPKDMPAKPAGLDWDLWIGPAAVRPFHTTYFPGPKWYRWWEFGNGTMSDLGSHSNDLAFWALNLKAPKTVEAKGIPVNAEIAPATMSAVYEYGPRGSMPAVKHFWYQGEDKPPHYKDGRCPKWGNASLFVGDKGMLISNYDKHVLLPEKDFKEVKLPVESIPRVKSHWLEWTDACKGNGKTLADFEYSGWLTEANHLGNVAYRTGKKLIWNAETMTAENAPEAAKYLKREYRKGWEVS